MRIRGLPIAVAVLLASAGIAGGQPKPCDIDNLPAATLLIPYFEVTLTDPLDGSSFVAVINTSSVQRIAHVTLWTNWAIPTASFDIVLAPNDTETFDFTNIFVNELSLQPESAGCQGTLRPGTLHVNPALRAGTTAEAVRTRLIQAHRGDVMVLSTGSFQASEPQENGPYGVRGYVTIDVVNRCTTAFPSTTGYFRKGGQGIASDANALIGDVYWTDYRHGVSYGEPAVHIRAHPTAFRSGEYTFYGRYVGGQALDDRQALARRWGSRFLVGTLGASNMTSNLLVWRDTKSSFARPVRAGSHPPWYPLSLGSFHDWDEDAATAGDSLHGDAACLATQRIDLNDLAIYSPTAPFGWLKMDLGHARVRLFGTDAQAWVDLLVKADHFQYTDTEAGIGMRVFPLESRCR